MAHPWFKSIDIKALENYDVKPLFMPSKDENGEFKFFNIDVSESAMTETKIP